MPTLKVTTLTKRFGPRLVIDRLSFEVNEGIMGVAGSNGSGKTTLLRCLAGLILPTSGTVTWEFDSVKADRESIRRNVGLAGPWLQLYREMSCFENLAFLAKLHGISDAHTRISDTLELVGLARQKTSPYGSLSSGQQQRMKIASAIIHRPRALLLDEPGSNLDDDGSRMISSLLSSWRGSGRIVVLASNDARELDLCDRRITVSPS